MGFVMPFSLGHATVVAAYQERWEQAFPWLGNEVGLGISLGNLAGALVVLLIAALLHGVLRFFCRNKIEQFNEKSAGEPEHEREARSWFRLMLNAGISPL